MTITDNSLRRLVDAHDRAHNAPRALARLERTGGKRRVCLVCRTPDATDPFWWYSQPACPCGGAWAEIVP